VVDCPVAVSVGVFRATVGDELSANIIHDIAPSSPSVPPVQVTAVVVRAVVRVAVVNPNAPASTSKSSVALAQVALTVSVAFPATAINPPPDAMVIDPVR
jgi:hypothetical protein